MSSQENRIISYLISSLLVVAFYSIYVIQQYQAGGFETGTIASSWGTAILVAIGAQILLSIIGSIVASIIHAIATRQEEVELSDERDQLIDLRANRISFSVFGIGFALAMITLALGLPPLVMFNLIVFSLFGASIVGYITQLYLYRRGF